MPLAQPNAPVGEPQEYIYKLYDAFKRAERAAGGGVLRYFRLANQTLCLRFASAALVPIITPALAHAAAQPDAQPDLTICLCDSVSTKQALPPPSWPSSLTRKGELTSYSDGKVFTGFQREGGSLYAIDVAERLGIFWTNDHHEVPGYEQAHPLLMLLHCWLKSKGLQLVHAAAVGSKDKGVLIVGRSGAGKTTVALACLLAGMSYAGDDYVAMEQPGLTAHCLYSSAHADLDALARLGSLAAADSPAHDLQDKHSLFLTEQYPDLVVRSMRIKAIITPRLVPAGKARLLPVSAGIGLAQMAASTILLLPNTDANEFASLAAVARQVPSFALQIGPDPRETADLILQLLATRGVG